MKGWLYEGMVVWRDGLYGGGLILAYGSGLGTLILGHIIRHTHIRTQVLVTKEVIVSAKTGIMGGGYGM